MLFGVIGVNGVGHVCRQEEAPMDGLEVLILSHLGSEARRDSLGHFNEHVAVSTLGRLRTNFLMVE